MPDGFANPKTQKQKLTNKVLEFLVQNDCAWRSDEVTMSGGSLITALTDTLWTIDGHHQVLGSQGYRIPPLFAQFNGYNKPELSKHRKRQLENLSGSVLTSLSSHLFHCLQGSYWHRDGWKEKRSDVESLARCISKYTDYLGRSKKQAMLNHSLTSPVRELSKNLTFQFLPVAESSTSLLSDLQSHLEEENTPFLVENVCPTNPRVKYNFVCTLRRVGFTFTAALLTYTHGNNVGNLHFVWRVTAVTESSFTSCQKVIEEVKQKIPVYHTRVMRQAMFNVYLL